MTYPQLLILITYIKTLPILILWIKPRSHYPGFQSRRRYGANTGPTWTTP